MEPSNSWLSWSELSKLHQGLMAAPDSRIARVVAMVDALETRGIADDVIAPLRPRLAQLRPPRPLRFCRLMFMPLDPLIVSASDWQFGKQTIPRTVLVPFARLVHAVMGNEADAVDAAIMDHTAAETDVVQAVGRRLWPEAARVLSEAGEPPPDWQGTALPSAQFAELARTIAILLAQTNQLCAVFAEAEIGVALRVECLIPLVMAAAQGGTDTLAMMAALVLARVPEARQPLILAGTSLGRRGDSLVRSAVERATDVLLARLDSGHGIEALVVGSTLNKAAVEVHRIRQLISRMDPRECTDERQVHAVNIAMRLDESCRLRFSAGLEMEFTEALHNLGPNADDTNLAQVETIARGLHDLEGEAREIGNAEVYDTLLRQAAALVKATRPDDALGLIDRVRLVEILLGPEEALTMLEPAGGENADQA